MSISTLDRYLLFELALLRWALLLMLGTFLLMLGDFIGQMGYNVQLLKNSHFDLLARYYLLRFPEFLLVWLPMSLPGAALLTAIPMLRQRTVIALAAAGIPPRRVFAALIPLALVCGGLGFVLKDQVVPSLQDEIEYVQALMDGKMAAGEMRATSAGWRSRDTHWSVQAALPAVGDYRIVVAFRQAARYDDDLTVVADRLHWVDRQWLLENVVVVRGGQQRQIARATPRDLGLEQDFAPETLALALRPDDAKTSDEVHKSKGTRYKQVLAQRVAWAFLPLLCLLFALPSFLRQGRGSVGTATAASLILAVVPMVALGALGKLMISAGTDPVILASVLVVALLAVGVWRWWRMSL
jgi:lipopolysaccharide export LptBFGC system permease protein LptF